jgi:hypothetical protein
LFIHGHIFTFKYLSWHSITKILRNGPRAHFPFTYSARASLLCAGHTYNMGPVGPAASVVVCAISALFALPPSASLLHPRRQRQRHSPLLPLSKVYSSIGDLNMWILPQIYHIYEALELFKDHRALAYPKTTLTFSKKQFSRRTETIL